MRRGARRALTALIVAALAGVSAAAVPASAHEAPVLVATFQDPLLDESSGVVVGSLADGYFFTHEDSGGGSVFLVIGPSGETVARYQLPFGPYRSIDWEGAAHGPGADGRPSIFLGDIGDNARSRPFVTVYEVAEPPFAHEPLSVDAEVVATHHFVYPDGPHDAEALIVDPATGRLGVVTKDADGRSGVYLGGDERVVVDPPAALVPDLPAPAWARPVSATLFERVATIDLGPIASPYDPAAHFSPTSRLLVTGGDVAPDGSHLVVRTYVEAFEWSLGPGGVAGGLIGPPHQIALAATGQGEAITYAHDGVSLLTTSEGVHAPIHLVPSG